MRKNHRIGWKISRRKTKKSRQMIAVCLRIVMLGSEMIEKLGFGIEKEPSQLQLAGVVQ